MARKKAKMTLNDIINTTSDMLVENGAMGKIPLAVYIDRNAPKRYTVAHITILNGELVLACNDDGKAGADPDGWTHIPHFGVWNPTEEEDADIEDEAPDE